MDDRTPMVDELEKGPWPSYVKELKRAAKKHDSVKDLIKVQERSFERKMTQWKHGGIVGVKGYGGGVIGRYVQDPKEFPNVAAFHTLRVNHPSGWFYDTKALRTICDIWDKHGSGMTNFHGSTGDIILLGCTSEELQPTFDELSEHGFDLGGSGSDLRTPTGCVGPGRCEWACFDTLGLIYDITKTFQSELHRPPFPYKTKIKASGCPNDCVAAIARSDFSIIGTWRDRLRIDQDAVKKYAESGFDIQHLVVAKCPTEAIEMVKGKLELTHPDDCVRCMHCINLMPKAIRPGVDTGATILVGAKAPVIHGAVLSSVLIPFVKVQPPYTEIKQLWEKIVEWWDENGKARERLAELIDRMGMPAFLKAIDVEPCPQMIYTPRANPYYFWDTAEVKK
ncbi:MAG: sulfite reductase, dissimilatory-type subunit alpha [Chloroflexi bacterium RBG_13_52_14]|nr:MAG: sulfite reductase, dissimilatory-type subunit alpha [Chloroflexi bacterium RBG_13_52_14]